MWLCDSGNCIGEAAASDADAAVTRRRRATRVTPTRQWRATHAAGTRHPRGRHAPLARQVRGGGATPVRQGRGVWVADGAPVGWPSE